MDRPRFLRELLLNRRRFLAGFTAGCATGTSATAWSTSSGDAEDLAAAQRLFGLDFTAEQLAQIAPRAGRQRRLFAQLRGHAVQRWTAPAFSFDPWPAGAKQPTQPGKFSVPPGDGKASTKPEDLAYASIPELAGLLRAGRTTARKLTQLCIGRLKSHDPTLHCVVTLLEKQALAAADRADAEIARGHWRGLLHGIPFGAKDLFAWPGAPTTFGAGPFRDQMLNHRASVLDRLEKAGAILVAKLSLGALAMGDVWFAGRTRNPWNPRQGSSGSSAGSAAAVAAGLVPFALGTETCGSIVSPCVRCAVAGLRPTFGRVSRDGAMPLSWTMDKVGPIARYAIDLAIVFDAIQGPDDKDAMVRDVGFGWPRNLDWKKLRVGVLRSRGRARGHEALLAWLGKRGARVDSAEFPAMPYGALMQILSVEAATAFDDLTRSPAIEKLRRQGASSWPATFRASRFIPAVEYLRAMRTRTELIETTHERLGQFDVLVGDRALFATNLTGHPCVVLPSGKGRGRQPISTTLIGRLDGEGTLLAIANEWQKVTTWHRGRPL